MAKALEHETGTLAEHMHSTWISYYKYQVVYHHNQIIVIFSRLWLLKDILNYLWFKIVWYLWWGVVLHLSVQQKTKSCHRCNVLVIETPLSIKLAQIPSKTLLFADPTATEPFEARNHKLRNIHPDTAAEETFWSQDLSGCCECQAVEAWTSVALSLTAWVLAIQKNWNLLWPRTGGM